MGYIERRGGVGGEGIDPFGSLRAFTFVPIFGEDPDLIGKMLGL